MDIDECAAKIDNCTKGPSTYCSNTVGSYLCLCNPGYIQMGGNCVDIDECSTGSNTCAQAPNGTCINTLGSYNCSCNPGYSGDGRTCVDIDECKMGTHNCSVHANCTNSIGHFLCSCQSGFKGDGNTCGMFISQCYLGLEFNSLVYFLVCTDGQMKLLNGSSPSEGTVLMCYNNSYGTVCDDRWNELDAMVVCRTLGLNCMLSFYCTQGGQMLDTKILFQIAVLYHFARHTLAQAPGTFC